MGAVGYGERETEASTPDLLVPTYIYTGSWRDTWMTHTHMDGTHTHTHTRGWHTHTWMAHTHMDGTHTHMDGTHTHMPCIMLKGGIYSILPMCHRGLVIMLIFDSAGNWVLGTG